MKKLYKKLIACRYLIFGKVNSSNKRIIIELNDWNRLSIKIIWVCGNIWIMLWVLVYHNIDHGIKFFVIYNSVLGMIIWLLRLLRNKELLLHLLLGTIAMFIIIIRRSYRFFKNSVQ